MKKLKQNFLNLTKAFNGLEKALATPPVEDRDFAGIIQNFEFVYELVWKTLKLILENEKIEAPFPRIVFEESFKRNLVEGNEIWKIIMEDRNLSVHTYDEDLAHSLCKQINENYFPVFKLTIGKIENYIKSLSP